MLEIEGVTEISNEMRAMVEGLWPELVHKLPTRHPYSWGPIKSTVSCKWREAR